MRSPRTRPGSSGGARRRASSRPVRAGARAAVESRPGRRRTRRPPRGAAAARRGPRFTGRAVLLGALLLLLALTLAGPVRQYVAGRQDLATLAAEHVALTRQTADLQTQLAQQADPAYIEQQARQRLTYVLPGDRLIVVGDAGGNGDSAGTDAQAPAGRTDPTAPVPWYTGLLDSVAAADGNPPAARAPVSKAPVSKAPVSKAPVSKAPASKAPAPPGRPTG